MQAVPPLPFKPFRLPRPLGGTPTVTQREERPLSLRATLKGEGRAGEQDAAAQVVPAGPPRAVRPFLKPRAHALPFRGSVHFLWTPRAAGAAAEHRPPPGACLSVSTDVRMHRLPPNRPRYRGGSAEATMISRSVTTT